MTDITLITVPREDVLTALGPDWPPAPGATIVRIPGASGVEDGAVVVYETSGQPGTTWWLVDGIVPPQGAGPGGNTLAALLPGAATEIVPDPVSDSPPTT